MPKGGLAGHLETWLRFTVAVRSGANETGTKRRIYEKEEKEKRDKKRRERIREGEEWCMVVVVVVDDGASGEIDYRRCCCSTACTICLRVTACMRSGVQRDP